MTSRGTVRQWDVSDMAGVIDSDDTPGGSWTPWAAAAVDGFPALAVGQEVEFEWHRLDEPSDGYHFLTDRAWPVGTEPHTPSTAFSTRLWRIDPDGTVHEITDLPHEPIPHRTGTWSTGIVSAWHNDEGWGVIDSPQTPGGCRTYYSALHPDEVIDAPPGNAYSIGGGIHGLDVGEHVDFEWEPVGDQDGYTFRTIRVRPRRDIPPWRIERHDL
ncbi:hypothetical protein ACNHUS_23220 [Actinomycetes bacterium M1A6_2h]